MFMDMGTRPKVPPQPKKLSMKLKVKKLFSAGDDSEFARVMARQLRRAEADAEQVELVPLNAEN
jgi:hypothetical protein